MAMNPFGAVSSVMDGAQVDRNIADDRDDEGDAETDGREDKPCRGGVDRDDDAEGGCHGHPDGHDATESLEQPLFERQLVFGLQSANDRMDEGR